VIKRQLFCSERLYGDCKALNHCLCCTKWRNHLENVTSTGSTDSNSICFRRPDWIWSRSWMTESVWIEICRVYVASFCEWFLHIYRRYLLMFIDLIAWIHSICINSVEFSNIFGILKTNDVIPCVCMSSNHVQDQDHGSRPMKSHEFLRLLYKMVLSARRGVSACMYLS
jgi:hypothetical protein